ncbi:hypothetical protein SEA_YEEZY_78 [Gordonia phage Yeezy]|uniref:Uncharacterized protein n=1 Tax=Gordonia phage Yeezy TaxID=1821565 RepID=A0A142K9P0_9CAUD|nr:hypothetical protein SEA_YEEZY_78 [Gordonia phage Yeezy]AMS02823.1 hypothetical protein SEA_YEEZY_78 [Gordonia phage Yeezy]
MTIVNRVPTLHRPLPTHPRIELTLEETP